MKYLKPEMDIVEFDESVLTGGVEITSIDDNKDPGGVTFPKEENL